MAWLAKLDARTAHASRWVRWPYLSLRWFLIAMGGFIAIGMAIQELREHRVGLGTGIATMLILATVKGVVVVITSHTPGSPSGREHQPLAH